MNAVILHTVGNQLLPINHKGEGMNFKFGTLKLYKSSQTRLVLPNR